MEDKMQTLIYALIKEAQRDSFVDFLKCWGLDYEEDWPTLKADLESNLGIEVK